VDGLLERRHPSLSTDENKALIQRVYTEGFNKGILAVVDEVFAPHFVDHSTPDQAPGIDGVKEYITAVRKGFPDISVTIEDLVATIDSVAARTTWCGAHLGEYERIAPTGKQIARTMIQIFRVVEGKLSEEWSEGESLRQQISQ
jgi:predicted ester cyclase